MQVLDIFNNKRIRQRRILSKILPQANLFVLFTLYADVSLIALLLGKLCGKHNLIHAVCTLRYLIMIGKTVVREVSLRRTVR